MIIFLQLPARRYAAGAIFSTLSMTNFNPDKTSVTAIEPDRARHQLGRAS